MKPGALVVVSGPSGVGKTTVVKELLKLDGFARSVSATTRAPRPGEIDGRDYFFWPEEKFEKEAASGGFLEHARIVGHRYGTPAAAVEAMVAQGKIVILAIDVQGFDALRRAGRPFVGIFLMPPSVEELRRRIEGRADTKDVEARMARAMDEMKRKDEYDAVIVNRTVPQAVADIVNYLKSKSLLEA